MGFFINNVGIGFNIVNKCFGSFNCDYTPMCLKFREEITNPRTLVKFLIDDNFEVILDLAFLAFNIKKEVCGVLESFLSF
jgi:hypothetical protein